MWPGSAGAGDAVKRFCSKQDGDFTSLQNQSFTHFSNVASRYPRRLWLRGSELPLNMGRPEKRVCFIVWEINDFNN